MTHDPSNILVTGGAGFIGTNFVRRWLASSRQGHVVVLDALTYAGNSRSLAGLDSDSRFTFVRGDICDHDLVCDLLERHQVDTLVHFAAQSHVDRSILGPDEFIRANVLGTHSLLKAAKSRWIDRSAGGSHRFHHVSTDEVYGSLAPADSPFHEKSPYAPNSPYSASKAASDHLVRAYHETYGLQTTVTNCSNNYGPYQFPEKLIPLTIINILAGKPLPIYGDGRQIRDWLHVEDHCDAIELAITRGRPGEVYNIGGNSETANLDLVTTLCGVVDDCFANDAPLRDAFPTSPAVRGGRSADLITHVRDRPGHDRRYAINYEKATRELGYKPAHDLVAGLRATVAWYLKKTDWWKALLGRDYAAWVEKNYTR